MAIVDDSVPTGPQIGTKYILVGPDGTRVTFNDPSDEDNVGMLAEITGFDSPDVRESAEDLVQLDGGVHGDFFFGRRPITLSGIFLNPESAEERNYRMTKLQRASRALRGNAVLSWEIEGGDVAGGNWQQLSVRRQQPLRISGGWQKEFQLALVAADPRIYSEDVYTSTVAYDTDQEFEGVGFPLTFPFDFGGSGAGVALADNRGNAQTWPVYTISGLFTGLRLTNVDTGDLIDLSARVQDNPLRARRMTLTVDTLARTVRYTDPFGFEFSIYHDVNFSTTSWFPLEPGLNRVKIEATSLLSDYAPTLTVSWRNAWM